MPDYRQSHIAVLYFSLSPEAEVRQKTFVSGSGYQANVKVAELLRDHTGRQIAKSGLPCVLFDEENQTGETFGEKIVNAFTAVFEKGYDHVIAVGNDTPDLRSRHLLQGSELLCEGNSDIVLGPAADGGTWLMGFSRDAFSPDKIETLPWNTSSLLSTIIEQFNDSESLYLMERFGDIDNADDLETIFYHRSYEHRNELEFHRLRQQILQLINKADGPKFEKRLHTSANSYHYSFLLRGPPSASDIRQISE